MRSKLMITVLLLGLGLLCGIGAIAQTTPPPTPQFAFTGFIQEATLDLTGATTGCVPADPQLAGGTMTINGIKMIVPCNTLMQLPAATMMWADLFVPAKSAPVGTYIGAPGTPVPANPTVPNIKTGLALADSPLPFPSFAVTVKGNIVGKNADDTDRYIIGLIAPVEQQVANVSQGFVSYIDYNIGAFRVGGVVNDANCQNPGIIDPSCSGTLVQINDPVGRWGLTHSPDPRFSGDYENTTIHTSTGFPACIPRVAPPANFTDPVTDPECPHTNRPLNGDPRFPVDPFLAAGAPLKKFEMLPPPGQPGADPSGFPDATKQIPIMVGDQVLFSGTIYKIDPNDPDNTSANTYVSAHTLEDRLGIFTAPGVPPAYMFVEEFMIGAGGSPIQDILQEAATLISVVGFTSDPTRLVEIYAQDISPCDGQESLRLLGITDPATQPLRGRFVHAMEGGDFMPPTRNYVVKSQNQFLDPNTGQRVDTLVANGIVAGKFLLPNFDFIMPVNDQLGDPLVPFNFQDFPFLKWGSGPVGGFGSATAILGQLDPWPGSPAPAKAVCTGRGLPIVNAGGDLTTGSGAAVQVPGSVSLELTSVGGTFRWTQTGGPGVALTGAAGTVTSAGVFSHPALRFTAPTILPGGASLVLTFQLTVTDQFGTSTPDAVNVTVTPSTDNIAAARAVWIPGTNKQENTLKVTAADSVRTANLTVREIVAATGKTRKVGAMGPTQPPIPGRCTLTVKGAPAPRTIIINSNFGDEMRLQCGPPNAKGRITCR